MSYQEIKRISRGRKWMIILLACYSITFLFFRKMAVAQNITELTGSTSVTQSNYTCSLQYVYTTEFDNYVTRDNQKVFLGDVNNTVNKCEPISVEIKKTGLWDGRMIYSPPPPPPPIFEMPAVGSAGACACSACSACACACGTPPADFSQCTSLDDCLSRATEGAYSLDSPGMGKGVFQEPTALILAETNSSPYMTCVNNVCTSYTSGNYNFNEKTAATNFYGQCRDTASGTTIKVSSGVGEAANQFGVTIANRPPVPTVSFDKSSIAPNEETNVTCDIVDPDECSDKIAKVKWTCADSTGNSNNCFIWKEDTGIFTQGSAFQDLVPSEQSNPFRANAKFKATTAGNYSVTCEATDNDANNPMTGTGINGITVAENCGADGICNANCPADPDCGVVAAHNGYCAIISQDGGSSKTLCGESGTAKYNAYVSGIDAQTYKWKCAADSNEQVSTSPDITCAYNNSGSFLPSLSIVDKSGKETQCVTQASATVTKDSSCKIQVNNTNVNLTDQVEATLSKQCLTNGVTNWQATNGTILSKDSNSAKIKFNTSGTNQIKAQIVTPDGKTTDCGTSDINVKEKVQFGL